MHRDTCTPSCVQAARRSSLSMSDVDLFKCPCAQAVLLRPLRVVSIEPAQIDRSALPTDTHIQRPVRAEAEAGEGALHLGREDLLTVVTSQRLGEERRGADDDVQRAAAAFR